MTVCWVPYKEVHFYAQNGFFSYCCKQPDDLRSVNDVEHGSEILDNDFLKNLKTDLYQNKKHSACNTCWKAESQKNISWRMQEGTVPDKYNDPQSLLSDNVYVDHVNLYFDNTCDLACVYCNSTFSSRWKNEIQNNNNLKHLTHLKNEKINEETNSVDTINKIVQFFEGLGKSTKSNFLNITVLGGEPLLSPQIKDGEFKKFLLAFYKYAPSTSHCILTIHTNANTPEKVLNRFLYDFNSLKQEYANLVLKIVLSIDTVGDPSEFIRYGSKWKIVEKNVNTYFEYTNNVQFYPTFSILNLQSFDRYIDFLADIHAKHNSLIMLKSGVVYEPAMLNPYNKKQNLEKLIAYLDKNKSIFVDTDYLTLKNRLADIEKYSNNNHRSIKELKRYFKYIEKVRHQKYKNYLGKILNV